MEYLFIIKEISQIVFPILTFTIAIIGLSTWRRKLWGENKFSMARNTLNELYILKEEIKSFRNGFYSAGEIYSAIENYKKENPDAKNIDEHSSVYAEFKRWEKVISQFQEYNSNLIRLKVLLDDYDVDSVDDKGVEDFIRELYKSRIIDQDGRRREVNLNSMDDNERKEHFEELKKASRVLIRGGENDEFEENIEEYFNGFKKKLKQYIKR